MDAWQQLMRSGLTSEPSEAQKKIIGRLDPMDMLTDWLFKIEKRSPEILTPEGRNAIEEARSDWVNMWEEIDEKRDQENRRGKYAPLIMVDELFPQKPGVKGTATDAQKKYLRDLGVRNQDALLARITKKEASQLIDEVLKLRGDA